MSVYVHVPGQLVVLSCTVLIEMVTYARAQAAFSGAIVISSDASAATAVFAADIDGDSHIDIVAALRSTQGVIWYQNTDGMGTFDEGVSISSTDNYARSVVAVDLNGDDFVDILFSTRASFSSSGSVSYAQNIDGEGEL